MSGCALCEDYNHKNPHQVQLKPKCAGVRILTLDGGGIRGIVELALLQALHKSVGLGVQISELFDLVVGTSTGMSHRDMSHREDESKGISTDYIHRRHNRARPCHGWRAN